MRRARRQPTSVQFRSIWRGPVPGRKVWLPAGLLSLALVIGACTGDESMESADLQSALAADDDGLTGTDGSVTGTDATGGSSAAESADDESGDGSAIGDTSSTTTTTTATGDDSKTGQSGSVAQAADQGSTTTNRPATTAAPRTTTSQPPSTAPPTTAPPTTAPTTTEPFSGGALPAPAAAGPGMVGSGGLSFQWSPVAHPALERYGIRLTHKGAVLQHTFSSSPSAFFAVDVYSSPGKYCAGIGALAVEGSGYTDSARSRICIFV